MECLQKFRNVPGLVVNTAKSDIFTAGIQNNELDSILARTKFSRGEMPVRYLGIPLSAKQLSIADFSLLVDRIENCICKWRTKFFSFTGRLELIRSVIQGVECFWPSLPTSSDGGNLPSKEEGGLGIRHIQSWNVALLARVLWNIHRKADTMWVQWINDVYLRGISIWDWQPNKGDSPLLQRLVEIHNRVVIAFGSSKAAIQRMAGWSDIQGLETSKAYEYFS
ncbi:hypothetical protein Salat_1124400 [Sesamum alatum]|uniref:Reverse transcriptase n=1 Tax=Sesamum alatum TaxID=300844 RepID=A0AAE1YEQ9_9LAMI|nr:hypothetical protein Salat_1124400 [Sesamum alatum]